MKKFFLACLILFVSFLIGCEQGHLQENATDTTDVGDIEKPLDLPATSSSKGIKDTMEENAKEKLEVQRKLMEISYDLNVLIQRVEQEYSKWNQPDQTMTYTINNALEEEQQVIGLYHSPMEWEMVGKLGDDRSFKMTNLNESVILEYDEQKHTLNVQEFSYLLPHHHLTILQDSLQEKHASRLTWTKTPESWVASVQFPLTSLSDDILAYLSHGDLSGEGAKHPFTEYFITYELIFSADQTSLAEITFSINKGNDVINQLTFIL
ncbi:hypothetical protein [Bacillus horti]|uniref:Lipoprotein n=1 Tax=Caldalkalibacillus horti TaxID=77523 RepID=A0ABT9VY15_9BACI|nr:hypothetical protein [Bacillus horti]MDQ0165510.1 hypothetical protein [Bacillus horti]